MIHLNYVTVPKTYGLWAPKVGYIHGCIALSRAEAKIRLADRQANHAAFPRERVRRLVVNVSIQPDGGITGHLT